MFLRDDTSLVCLFYWRGVRLFSSLQPCSFGKSSSKKTARQSVERFRALASAKYMAGQEELGGDLVQKVKLEHLEEEIIDLWHYVYALRLRLKDD